MTDEKDTDIYYKLGEMHGDIKSTLNEAKRTNGRVTVLEKDVATIKIKIASYSGAVAVAIWIAEKILTKYL